MCLYMSVPLWINVERLTTAVSATASQLFDVSLVILLLNCKSSTVVATKTAVAAATAKASTTVTSSSSSSSPSATTLKPALHDCKHLKQTQIQSTTTTKLTKLPAITKSLHEAVDKIHHNSLPPHNVNNNMLDDAGV